MARLFSSGFELNSLAAGVEVDQTVGNVSIVTNVVRSGTYALLADATGGLDSFIGAHKVSNGSVIAYLRFHIYIAVLPSSTDVISSVIAATGSDVEDIVLNGDGTLQINGIGGSSPPVAVQQWNRVEIKADFTTPSAVNLQGRLNGIQFENRNDDLSALPTLNNWAFIQLGASGDLHGKYYFDDIAFNDSTGPVQNSWPGDSKIIALRPSAAGDVNTFSTQTGGTAGSSNNYTRVNEVTPDDAVTLNGSNTLNQEDLFRCGPSGIGPLDTINVVHVGARFRNNTADASTAFKLEIEKAPGGTISQSAAIVPNTTTWNTNAPAIPDTYPLTLYNDPDGSPWRQATLDTMQIGYKLTTAGTNRIDVSTVWALVDYTPAAPLTNYFTSGVSNPSITIINDVVGY